MRGVPSRAPAGPLATQTSLSRPPGHPPAAPPHAAPPGGPKNASTQPLKTSGSSQTHTQIPAYEYSTHSQSRWLSLMISVASPPTICSPPRSPLASPAPTLGVVRARAGSPEALPRARTRAWTHVEVAIRAERAVNRSTPAVRAVRVGEGAHADAIAGAGVGAVCAERAGHPLAARTMCAMCRYAVGARCARGTVAAVAWASLWRRRWVGGGMDAVP